MPEIGCYSPDMLKRLAITLGTGFGISLLATIAFDHGPCGGVFLVFGGGLTLLVACGVLIVGLIGKVGRRPCEADPLNPPESE